MVTAGCLCPYWTSIQEQLLLEGGMSAVDFFFGSSSEYYRNIICPSCLEKLTGTCA